MLKFHGKYDLAKELSQWEIPKFPLTGDMLKENGCPHGIKTGIVMQELKVRWYESNFKLNSKELLEFLPESIEKHKNATDVKTSLKRKKLNDQQINE